MDGRETVAGAVNGNVASVASKKALRTRTAQLPPAPGESFGYDPDETESEKKYQDRLVG